MAKTTKSNKTKSTNPQSVDQREERKVYFAIKRKVLEHEKDNYTELVAVRTPDKLKNGNHWWKMFGHSAVFYKYWVGERLKHKVRLLPDSDYEVQSKEGYVSIDNIERLKQMLAKVNIYAKGETERAIVFKLGERITEQDYVMMLHEEETRIEMANKLILPKAHMTDLHAKTKDAMQVIHECVRKMDGASREAFASEMERKAVELEIIVLRTARGTMDVDYCLERAYDIAEDLYGFVSVMLNLRMLEASKLYRLAEVVVALETQIKKETKKRLLKEADENIKTKVKTKKKAKKDVEPELAE